MNTFRQLSERVARFVSIGNPKARAMAVYDLAAKVRNFGGEMAMSLADPGDPYGELALLSPKVKSTGKKMVAAMDAFVKAVMGSEDSIDITPRVRARLREGLLDEKSQPKLNKYDPGSLLGWTIHLLQKEGLEDAAEDVRAVSRKVSKAWQERER